MDRKISISWIFMFSKIMVKIGCQLFQVLTKILSNTLSFASSLVKYSFKIVSIYVFSFLQNYQISSVLFLIKIFVQKPCKETLRLFKRSNIPAKYANLHNHILANKNSANGECIALKKCFVSSRSLNRRERTLLRDNHLASAWRRKWS